MRQRRGAPTGSSTEPVPLSRSLDTALEQLRAPGSVNKAGDGILFAGNPHESVPRALFMDTRITPLERNAWQVFRVMLNDDGVTAFPTYEQLRPYLASMPCSGNASDETIARALTLLRLTRWLSLVRHRRDADTGRIQGNLYVLHDEPLTPYEVIQLDPRYLTLVSHALTHASKAIQRVGYHTLREITEDPLLSGRVLPSRLQTIVQHLASQGEVDTMPEVASSEEPTLDASESLPVDVPEPLPQQVDSPRAHPSSDSEAGLKASTDNLLRNPKQDRTVRTESINKNVGTVPRTREGPPLQVPEQFTRLRPEQQAGALAALQQVDPAIRQAVLDEWAARCQAPTTIRNPAGYLFGLIQRAIRGEFRAWAGQRTAAAPERMPASPRARPETAQQHIARLRDLLKIR